MSGKRRAIISVSDKRGAVELGAALAEAGWEVLSTGGTANRCATRVSPCGRFPIIRGIPKSWAGV